MTMTISREEFGGLREDIRDGFKGINDRLDLVNGRVRKSEIDIGIMQSRLDAVEKAQEGGELFSPTKRKFYALVGLATIGVAVEIAKMLLQPIVNALAKGIVK